MDVDSLAAEVKRATELIAGCKSRLRKPKRRFQNTGIVMTEKSSSETVPADLAAIVEVHKKGFGYDKEAGLTAELLSDPTAEPTVSLLALRDGKPSATSCSPDAASPSGSAAAVVLHPRTARRRSLLPEAGVGGLLIAEGLQLLRERARNSSSYSDTRSTTRATASFPSGKTGFPPLIRF